jgi:hypothetical protein
MEINNKLIGLLLLVAILIISGYINYLGLNNEYIDSDNQDSELEEDFVQITPMGDSVTTSLYLPQRYGREHVNITLHGNVYEYYVNKDIHYCYTDQSSYDCYVTPLEDPNDNYIIEEIVSKVAEKSEREGDNLVRQLLYAVTKIPYDELGLINDPYHIKTPYGVLYTNSGVCSEKSMLLAKMLKNLGYGVAFFVYNDENHMTLGIKCNSGNYETDYCFMDPTGPGPSVIGHPPAYFWTDDLRYSDVEIIVYAEGKAMDVEAGDYITEEERAIWLNESVREEVLCENYCVSVGASEYDYSSRGAFSVKKCKCYFEGVGWREAEAGWRNLE